MSALKGKKIERIFLWKFVKTLKDPAPSTAKMQHFSESLLGLMMAAMKCSLLALFSGRLHRVQYKSTLQSAQASLVSVIKLIVFPEV